MTVQTLNDIALLVARRYSNALSGAATTTGTTTTLTDTTNLIQPDNAWVNHYVRFTSGAHSGAERLITESSQTNNRITWTPALSSVVANGVTYTILPRQWIDFETAIKNAILAAGTKWLRTKDHAIPFSINTIEYALPADTLFLVEVFLGRPANYEWHLLSNWDVTGTLGAYKLILRADTPYPFIATPGTGDSEIRLSYVTTMKLMSSGTDTTELGALLERDAVNFIVEYALHVLHEQAMTRNITGNAARAHFTQSRNHLQEALRIKEMANAVHKVPQRVKTRKIPQHI